MIHSAIVVKDSVVPVEIHASHVAGPPGIDILGLAETAVRETRVRVRAALVAAGRPPAGRVSVEVRVSSYPSRVALRGAAPLDLAIALAVAGVEVPEDYLVVGELSLKGELRPVRGITPMLCAHAGPAILPRESAREAALVEHLTGRSLKGCYFERNLAEALSDAPHGLMLVPAAPPVAPSYGLSLDDIRGLDGAKETLRLALTGTSPWSRAGRRPRILLIGPPGSGKTMLARRAGLFLEPPSAEESIEIASVQSSAGLVPGLDTRGVVPRPFRAPHHTCSASALVGTADRYGEVDLARHGVLFLDEIAEFRSDVIEALKHKMESARNTVYIAATNPCPCGWSGSKRRQCSCPPGRIERHMVRVDRLPWDVRIDLRGEL